MSSFTATIWGGAPPSTKGDAIDKTPPQDELELFPLSIVMREMGHQLGGFPDLYTPSYLPLGVFDLMGGPAASPHFPLSLWAYPREHAGWRRYTDMPKESRGNLALWPLETHEQAFRLLQGPQEESTAVENRGRLEYRRDYVDSPVDKGPRVIVYRVDWTGRRRVRVGERMYRKLATMIRRPEGHGEVWGEGTFTEITGPTKPSGMLRPRFFGRIRPEISDPG